MLEVLEGDDQLDPFTNLSLDVTDSSTIGGCLEKYCRVERLPGRDYKCSGCGTAQMATKQLSIHRLPACLVLHVKRFEQTVQATGAAPSKSTASSKQQQQQPQPLQKIDKHLHFSTELSAKDLKASTGERARIAWWEWSCTPAAWMQDTMSRTSPTGAPGSKWMMRWSRGWKGRGGVGYACIHVILQF